MFSVVEQCINPCGMCDTLDFEDIHEFIEYLYEDEDYLSFNEKMIIYKNDSNIQLINGDIQLIIFITAVDDCLVLNKFIEKHFTRIEFHDYTTKRSVV